MHIVRPLQSASFSPEKKGNRHAAIKSKGYQLIDKMREKQKVEANIAKERIKQEDHNCFYQEEYVHNSPGKS